MIFTPTPRSIYLEIAQKRFKTILKSYLKFFNALAEVLKSFQNLLVKKISREIVGALSPTGKKSTRQFLRVLHVYSIDNFVAS